MHAEQRFSGGAAIASWAALANSVANIFVVNKAEADGSDRMVNALNQRAH